MKKLPEATFAEIAVALLEEANHYAGQRTELEVLSHRLAMAGLSESTRDRLMAEKLRQFDLIADAHKVMRALCDHEEEIRAIIGRPTAVIIPWPKRAVARLRDMIQGDRVAAAE